MILRNKTLFAGVLFSSFLFSANKTPNIIFILADDLGLGDLSCQGTSDIKTPNIDKLFSGGLVFSNFHASSTVSSPSRAALLTGRFPIMVGVPGVIRPTETSSFGYFLPSAVTLPTMLKQRNYETAIIGKWHLGFESPNLPNDRGFDFFKGFTADMMDDYCTHQREGKQFMYQNRKLINPQGHATDLFTDWAIEYVGKKHKNPYFLYLAYNAPHQPLQPPKEWEQKVTESKLCSSPTRTKLVALIEHLDFNIGRLYAFLEKNNQLENTIIFFTSDNGGDKGSEANNGATRGYKGDMYEGGIRVPFAVYHKETISPSKTDNFAVLSDIFPTLCDYLNISIPHKIDGISLLPIIQGKKMNTDDRFTFWVRSEGGGFMGKTQHAIRYNNYKLVQNNPFEPQRFYNITNDSLEKTPLKNEGEIFRKMSNAATEHFRKSGAVPSQK